MSLVNSRLMTLTATRFLNASNSLMQTSLTRLSTGLRINSAADDPAGSIISQYVSSQLASLESAIDNTQAAANIVDTASDALTQISAQLQDIRSLTLEIASSGSMTEDEIAANQASIDAAVEAINSLVTGTSFNGMRLIDGSQAVTTSGVNTSQLANLSVYSARFGSQTTAPVDINVTTSAQTAEVTHSGAALTSATTLQVQGALGTATLTFASGAAASAVVAAINLETSTTGVSATLSGADGIRMNSTTYGSDAFVSVSVVTGSFDLDSEGGTGTDYGRDAVAIVNGTRVQADGLDLTVSTSGLSFTATLDEDFGAGQLDVFHLTGGGMYFQTGTGSLSGALVGIGNMHASALGGNSGKLGDIVSGGSVNASDNASDALAIIDEAISQVSLLNGRLGGYSTYTLSRTSSVLQTAYTELTSTYELVAAADYAEETANYYQAQILNSASLSMLAIANQQALGVLTLLSNL